LVHRCGFSWEDAEDAAQQAIIQAVKVNAVYAGESPRDHWNWLIGVALNKARDIRRSRRQCGVSLTPEALDTVAVDPVASNEDGDLPPHLALVCSALDRLPAHLRELMAYVYLEGHTYAEAAQRFRTGKGVVSRRLREARELLRSELTALPPFCARAPATKR
jgi:RNA polymerase sigma factor (sigma-70 family)